MSAAPTGAVVWSVSRSAAHVVSKAAAETITLVAGLGVSGDCHAGHTVQHLSRVRRDPTQPNLRQVHLLHGELLDALSRDGFDVAPGEFGENITTRGMDLLGLGAGTLLRLGADAVVRVTGLRNPCAQINGIRPGLLGQVLRRAPDGTTVRLAGVMTVVVTGGVVRPGDPVTVRAVPALHRALEPV